MSNLYSPLRKCKILNLKQFVPHQIRQNFYIFRRLTLLSLCRDETCMIFAVRQYMVSQYAYLQTPLIWCFLLGFTVLINPSLCRRDFSDLFPLIVVTHNQRQYLSSQSVLFQIPYQGPGNISTQTCLVTRQGWDSRTTS